MLNEAFRGMKLLLDESPETAYGPSKTSKLLLSDYKKDAVEVAGDYLRQIVHHVHQVLQRRFGIASMDMNLEFVLTVPALWSDKADSAGCHAGGYFC